MAEIPREIAEDKSIAKRCDELWPKVFMVFMVKKLQNICYVLCFSVFYFFLIVTFFFLIYEPIITLKQPKESLSRSILAKSGKSSGKLFSCIYFGIRWNLKCTVMLNYHQPCQCTCDLAKHI